MKFCQTKSKENYKFLSLKQYQCHICSLNKIIIQNKFQSNCTKMKFVDWDQLFKIFLRFIYAQMHIIYQYEGNWTVLLYI